jgi:hypothetical protein
LYTEDNETIRIWTTLKSLPRCLNLAAGSNADQQDFLNACQYAADERYSDQESHDGRQRRESVGPEKFTDKLPNFVGKDTLDADMGTVTFKYVEPFLSTLVAAGNELIAGKKLNYLARKYGYETPQAIRHALKSEWLIGNKTRLNGMLNHQPEIRRILKDRAKRYGKVEPKTFPKQLKVRLEDFTHEQREKLELPEPIRLKTNLKPAVTQKWFDAVQEKLQENHNNWLRNGKYDDKKLGSKPVAV